MTAPMVTETSLPLEAVTEDSFGDVGAAQTSRERPPVAPAGPRVATSERGPGRCDPPAKAPAPRRCCT
jgi:hypothetical protein